MSKKTRSEMTRRSIVSTGIAASAASLMHAAIAQDATPGAVEAPYPELASLNLSTVARLMNEGAYSSVDLTQMYLDRIAALDSDGPMLKAVLELNPDALSIAAELDAERETGNVRGLLHGVPVLLKDNIDTADSMHTTAGSLALMNSIPPKDATVVARLREAGAVILGKTNLSEWANMRGFQSSSGWSARGGVTKNPYSLTRNPSGSSSGSAVAIAASLSLVALGTETNGSVVSPASVCGVVGYKPTVGFTSRAGVIPISHTQDSIGILAKSVADVAVTMDALKGVDDRDEATAASEPHVNENFTDALNQFSLQGARLGVPSNFGFLGYSNKADAVFAGVLDSLRSMGAEIVMDTDIPTADELNEAPGAFDRMVYEFKRDLNAYLEERGDPEFTSLADLIAFNNDHADEELRYFSQNIFEMSEATSDDDADTMQQLHERLMRLSQAEGIDAVLKEHNLDALIAPTMPPATQTDLANGEKFMGASSNLTAIAGYPIITVPAGLAHGLPVGLSFMGTAWSDARLISLAYAWERGADMYREPTFSVTDIAENPNTPVYELPPVQEMPKGTPGATPQATPVG